MMMMCIEAEIFMSTARLLINIDEMILYRASSIFSLVLVLRNLFFINLSSFKYGREKKKKKRVAIMAIST